MSVAKIRKMTTEDLLAVVEVENICFTTPWSEDSFRNELTTNMLAVYYVAEVDQRVVGYAGMWHVMDELHITNVAVHPEFRGKKIGNQLLEALIGFSSSGPYTGMTLEVRVSNDVAINLYTKYGFEKLGIRKGYYQDNKEDAIVMWKELNK
jgi:ribosomal-protein-alanine N-acetyltransferase